MESTRKVDALSCPVTCLARSGASGRRWARPGQGSAVLSFIVGVYQQVRGSEGRLRDMVRSFIGERGEEWHGDVMITTAWWCLG